MQLSLRDAAQILHVSEDTIYQWIREEGLPAIRVHDQVQFNRIELLEWIASHKGLRGVAMSPEILQPAPGTSAALLSAALEAGGIHHGIGGTDRASVLKALAARLRLPDDADRELLIDLMLAREKLGSTSIGDGIAIPHVRSPLIMNISQGALALCFLERPIDFAAPDGKPVDTLFMLMTPTVRAHLHLVSRLMYALNDAEFKSVLRRRGAAEEIFREARRVEAAIPPPSSNGHS
ncbi:MAG: PTS sugar transporter subunit IIA [Planctomycetes bacterium]|nr:PTS sugar transporter subunit IIA [Planctomycetota bacterium]